MQNLVNNFRETVKHWYVPLILGIVFILAGFYMFASPLATYLSLTLLFSVSFFVSGIMDIIFAIQNKDSIKGWGWYLVGGILSLVMGLYLMAYPGISIAVLPFVIGFTVMFRAFQLLGFSFDLKEMNIPNWGYVTASSVLGIIFAFLLLANPFFASMSLVSLTALTFIFVGIATVILSLNLKKLKDRPKRFSEDLRRRAEELQREIDHAASQQ